MKSILYIKNLLIFLIFTFYGQICISEINIKTIYKIEDKIITNIDIKNEFRYLVAVSPNFSKLDDQEALEIAKKSLIERNIKKIELEKFYEFGQNNKFLDNLILSNFEKNGLKDKEEIINYFEKFDVSYTFVLKKFEIDQLWKELIINKFNDKVEINEKVLLDKIKKINKEVKSYYLYEILFQINENENLEKKYQIIINDINKNGFEIAAKKYSISSSAEFGGKIEWIDDFQLSKKINDELKKINVNEITQPIRVSSGFLLLKIADLKKKKKEINIEKELSKLKNFERNKQLSSYSNIYYNKIMINSNVQKN